MILNQSKNYYQDLHLNIPLDWKVHHTPYGYMDRDGWIQSMAKFSNICGAFPVNNQIIFFDGHESHFNKRAPRQTECINIQTFVLKAGN